MTNCAWFERFLTARSEYLRFEGSDHRPLVSCLTNQQKIIKGLFKFDRRLKDNLEVQKLVSDTWTTNREILVEQQISRCRRAIIQWNKKKHKNRQKIIAKKQAELEQPMFYPTSKAECIYAINSELALAYKVEEDFWRQKSRHLWLSIGDKNTGYFHASTTKRRFINNITVIKDNEGKASYKKNKITETINNYFTQNIYLPTWKKSGYSLASTYPKYLCNYK